MKPTKRECGGCTLCCKLLAVPAIEKPQDKWCKHCTIGVGCAINGSEQRPEACGLFDCLWLQGYGDDNMRPDKSKVVMGMTSDGKSLVLYVDPSRPEAFREPAIDKTIDKLIANGMKVFVVCGDKRRMISNQNGEPT
jgi:hypothetical protein